MRLPPALKALLAQLAGWALAVGLMRAGVVPGQAWALVLAQAVGAVTAAVALRSDPWWRWIHAGFTPLAALVLQLGLHPAWYLTAFAALALVYWSSFRTQVPLFLSNPATAAAVARLVPPGHSARVLDLGSGTGALLRPLAVLRPDCRLEGMESAPAPYLLSRLLSRRHPNIALARGDFWQIPWTDYDLIYAFLSPVPMPEVWRKACAELRAGALLVSNSFPVDGIEPDAIVHVPDRRGTCLYCYHPAGPLPPDGRPVGPLASPLLGSPP